MERLDSKVYERRNHICRKCNSINMVIQDFCFDCGTQLCDKCGSVIEYDIKCQNCGNMPTSKFISYFAFFIKSMSVV